MRCESEEIWPKDLLLTSRSNYISLAWSDLIKNFNRNTGLTGAVIAMFLTRHIKDLHLGSRNTVNQLDQ